MHSEIRSLTPASGTDARQQLTSKIVATHELVRRAMERLAALDGSQYTAVPGSRPALEALASVVSAASIAASDLACALEANPLEGAPFPGPPADEAAVRKARHAEAVPVMAEHLADAAHQLGLAHTGCSYLATGITRDLKQHAEQKQATPPPKLTDTQYAVLARLSAGGGTLYETSRYGAAKAVDADRATVNVATLNALIKRGLVEVDASTSLYQGQCLHVTAEGRRALAQHRPTTIPARERPWHCLRRNRPPDAHDDGRRPDGPPPGRWRVGRPGGVLSRLEPPAWPAPRPRRDYWPAAIASPAPPRTAKAAVARR